MQIQKVGCRKPINITGLQGILTFFFSFFQVGLIILYDHVHPVGAFAKNSSIDVSTLDTLDTLNKSWLA